LAPALAVFAVVAAEPLDLAARAVLVAADLACVAVRPPALRALVPVALAPLAAALAVPLADDEERLVAGLEADVDLVLEDGERFGAGIRAPH
jgi:hypothetical protein